MLQNASVQRLSDPWLHVIETVVGAIVLWGAQIAGFLLISGEGTQWLLVGAEVGVLVGLAVLRSIHPETISLRRVLIGAAVLGLVAAILGGSDLWFPLLLVSFSAAGFILRTFLGTVIYPAPALALMFSSDVGELIDYVGPGVFIVLALIMGFIVWALVGLGVIVGKIEWDM